MSILNEIITTEYRAELRRRVLAGEDEDDAWTEIIQEFVDGCDPDPLVWTLMANQCTPAIDRILVSLVAERPLSNVETPTFINVASARPGARGLNRREREWLGWLKIDIQKLSEGREPCPLFRGVIANGFLLGYPGLLTSGQSPPDCLLKFTLKPRVSRRGNRVHPDTLMVDGVWAYLVDMARANDPTLTIAAAIDRVALESGEIEGSKRCEARVREIRRAVYDER